MPLTRRGTVAALLAVCALTPADAAPDTVPPVTVAVLAFDYTDTSGEVRDQTRAHAEWTQRMALDLQSGLTASGRYRGIGLDCAGKPCTQATADLADVAAQARAAGAAVMLFGTIEKQSTLISWARVRAVSTSTGAVVFDKFLSFRGDDDAAWQHMEKFVLREFLAAEVRP